MFKKCADWISCLDSKLLRKARMAPYVCVVLLTFQVGLWFWDRTETYATHADNVALVLGVIICFLVSVTLFKLQAALRERDRDLSALDLSESRYRMLIESAQEGIWVLDADLKSTLINAKITEMLGYTPEDVLGRHILDVIPRDVHEQRIPDIPKLCTTSARYEYWTRTKNRIPKYLSVSSTPIRDRVGNFCGILAMVTDLTVLKRAEEANARFAAIVESTDDAILGFSRDGIITECNPGAEKLYGYTRDELIGQPLSVIILPDKKQEAMEFLYSVCRGNAVGRIIATAVRKNGSTVPVSVAISPIVDDSGEVIGVSSVARDVTTEQASADALRRSEERFQLAARATHDTIWDWDIVNDRLWFSDNFWEQFGYSKEKLRSVKDLAELVHPDDSYVVEPTWETYGSLEYRLRKADGTWAWVRDRNYLVRDDAGHSLRKIGAITDITKEKLAEEAMRSSEERFRRLFERNLAGVYRISVSGRLLECNDAYAKLFGFNASEEMVGGDVRTFFIDPAIRDKAMEKLRQTGQLVNFDIQYRRRDGAEFTGLSNASLVEDEEGELTIVEGTTLDVTEAKRLQEQLLQAQKMEAVGRLAGGVSHDFNNLLMVISSYSELVLTSCTDERHRRYIERVLQAAHRGAELTSQLLAFSRKQIIEPRILDVNEVVVETAKMLPRLIREDIKFERRLSSGLARCKVDPGQLQQVIMNLCINAKDAMPNGGRLTIETSNVELDRGYSAGHIDVAPGRYVMLAVSDTGVGMDAATQSRVFEPFFTTKGLGKGTGLGLATVYGIVKQNKGYVFVYSELGYGSTFKVYLPATEEALSIAPNQNRNEVLVRGTGTILLVEDDDALRESTAEFLQHRGYAVIKAGNPKEALAHFEKRVGHIDILLTDVIMPEGSGPELAKAVIALSPTTAVIFMSGYAEHMLEGDEDSRLHFEFLQKPFNLRILAQTIDRILTCAMKPSAALRSSGAGSTRIQ